jgi:type I restriction enzyme, R subunit
VALPNLLTSANDQMALNLSALKTGYGGDIVVKALQIDAAVKKARPYSWRGNLPREQIIRQALYEVVGYEVDVERLFKIIYAQKEY